jgi:TolA-binding protein
MSEEIEIVEESQPKITVADMLRTTSQNTNNLLMQMADHIDKLEEEIVQLTNRIQVLESQK